MTRRPDDDAVPRPATGGDSTVRLLFPPADLWPRFPPADKPVRRAFLMRHAADGLATARACLGRLLDAAERGFFAIDVDAPAMQALRAAASRADEAASELARVAICSEDSATDEPAVEPPPVAGSVSEGR